MNRFDEIAENWDSDPQKVERASAVARQIRLNIPLNTKMKALEFGCGTGLLGFALKDNLAHITLVDNSQGMLEVLKRKIAGAGIKNMAPLLKDMTSEKEEISEKYDLVFTMMALHHIPRPEAILETLCNLLKAGGYLAVAELEKGEISFHGSGFDGHDGFRREKLSEMARMSGFEPLGFFDCFEIRREIERKIENFNVFLMTCRKNTA